MRCPLSVCARAALSAAVSAEHARQNITGILGTQVSGRAPLLGVDGADGPRCRGVTVRFVPGVAEVVGHAVLYCIASAIRGDT